MFSSPQATLSNGLGRWSRWGLTLGLLSTLLLGACSRNNPRPSILVIAVDRLGSDAIDCSKDRHGNSFQSGFEILCSEFVRWPHVYTSSPMAVPAMTSLLSGEYPIDHHVHNNGANYLHANKMTVAESAYKNGWSTSFFSAGPPLLHKTGLFQGFEIFEDSFRPSFSKMFRSFSSNIQLYLSNLKEIGNQQSFTVIYVSDLNFRQTPTENFLGELRNFSYESQLEEFDENLYFLFSALKRNQHWDKSEIYIVGLNAQPGGDHPSTPSSMNIYSETTHVALFSKEIGPSKIDIADRNFGLPELGQHLFEKVDGNIKKKDIFEGMDEAHPVLIENGWADWQTGGEIQWAVKYSNFYCLLNDRLVCFDNSIDLKEHSPISLSDEGLSVLAEKIRNFPKHGAGDSQNILSAEAARAGFMECQKSLFSSKDGDDVRNRCDDPLLSNLSKWVYVDKAGPSEVANQELFKRKFSVELWFHLLDKRIFEMNKLLDSPWDLSSRRYEKILATEKIINDPKFLRYKAQAIRGLTSQPEE